MKNSKKVLILILVSLIIGGAAYFGYFRNAQITDVVSIGNWNTYINEEKTISFQYPKNWIIVDNSSDYVSFKTSPYDDRSSSVRVLFTDYYKGGGSDAGDYTPEEFIGAYGDKPKQAKIINNIPVVYIENDIFPTPHIGFIIFTPKKAYSFYLDDVGKNFLTSLEESDMVTLENIISTVSLLDPKDRFIKAKLEQ